MLFYLTDSLITDEKEEIFDDIFLALRNLTDAAFQSNHMLLGDNNVLTWFADILHRDPVKGVLVNLIHNYSTAIIPHHISQYVKVVKGEEDDTIENGKTVYLRNYSRFKNPSILDKIQIAGEDINDAKLYGHITKWYVDVNNINLTTSYKYYPGGGVNLERSVQNLKAQSSSFICITETDERYPGCDFGDTCKKCKAIEYKQPFETLHIINAHEIENIIPKSIIDSLNWSGQELNNKKNFDSIYTNINPKSHLRHIDLKDGLIKHEKFSLDVNWISFQKLVYEANDEVNAIEFQDKFDATGIKQQVYPGLGKTILKKTINFLEVNQLFNPTDFVDFQLSEWNSIGEMMLNRCVCRNTESLNL